MYKNPKDDRFDTLLNLTKLKDKKLKENKKSKKSVGESSKHKSRQISVRSDILPEDPKILRSEFNFLKFPFFDLCKKSKRDKIEIKENIENEKGKALVYWRVSRNTEHNFPSSLDKKVFLGVNKVIDRLPKPIDSREPIRLGSLRDICRLIRIDDNSGKNVKDIKEALERITATAITAKGTFYLKDKDEFLDRTFHLFDDVIFTGSQLKGGEKADAVYLYLSEFYIQNINANYVVPLHWEYYQTLRGHIVARMYEFLGLYFFVALENNKRFVQFGYSKLCDFFPIVRQNELWKAKKQLIQSHKRLLDDKFFSKEPEWIKKRNVKNDWIIRYWIGQRARDEWRRNKELLIEPIRDESKLISRPPSEDQEKLSLELINRGITKDRAEKLVKQYPNRIRKHIEYFDFLRRNKSPLISKNPAGFLRKSIEDNYSPPVGFISQEEQDRIDQTNRESQERIEKQRKINEYKEWLERLKYPKQCVAWDLDRWMIKYEDENNEKPTQEQIDEKQKELISKLPTKDELQRRIFGRTFDDRSLDLFFDNI